MSNNLQAFQSVVKNKTVVGAAKELGLTQTGITQRIKSLEHTLGASLFTRSRTGMTLTSEGEALRRYCIQSGELEGNVVAQIIGAGEHSPVSVTIAGPTSLVSTRLVDQLSGLYKIWPHLNLSFYIDDSEQRLNLIKSGKVQLVILRPQDVVNELQSKKLRPERYLLVGHPTWKGRKLTDIISTERIVDFHEGDPTTLNYLRKFDLLTQVNRERIFANENRTLISLFCAGVGYGTLIEEIAEVYLREGKLISLNSGKTLDDEVALAWYPRKSAPRYFADVIRLIK